MGNSFSEQDIRTLDRIIETRRSVRSFTADAPTDSMIKAVIHAGVYAPYAALAVGETSDYRRFFIFRKGTMNTPLMNEIIKETARASLEQVEKEIRDKQYQREKATNYIQRVSVVSQNGLPGLAEIPCFIVVAERRGIPSVEKQSLAHVMQNMWLKATALGLGFQLMSLVENATENPKFSKLLKLPFGEFAFNGCIIGYAAQQPVARKMMTEDRAVTWI